MEEPIVNNTTRNVEEINGNFKNPMHVAVLKDDVEAIESMANDRIKICEEENGQTPLHLAVMKGKTLAVRKLISLGANLSKLNKDGYAPLHLAVHYDQVSLIEDLINMNTDSDVDIFDGKGNTALHTAISMENANAVRALLIEGANADLLNKEGSAPLHLAARQGDLKVIDIIVKYVRKPNVLDKEKYRPLHIAVWYKSIGAIRKIGKIKGTNVHLLNSYGDSALHLATKLRNLEAIEALLDLNANVNLKNSDGFSSMHLALMSRERRSTIYLANIDEAERNITHVAEPQKNLSALKLLCRPNQKANVNIRNAFGDPLLHSVIKTGCKDAVKMLLDLGAKVNIRNTSYGMTPLHIAVCFGNKDIIEMLIQHGADIHSADDIGDMPIHSAAKCCSSVGIETMLKRDEHIITWQNRSGFTPLDLVMLYVREDAFGIAVQTVTDIFKKRRFFRRSPLESEEILNSAKIIFKFDIWKNFEYSKLYDTEYKSDIIPVLRSYANDCFSEIGLMKTTKLLNKKLNLYKFAKKGFVETMDFTREFLSDAVINHILDVSTTKGYPIYRDFITSQLERSSLTNKVLCLRIPVMYEGNTTYLDLEAVHKYLGKDDILNLLLAYPDPDADSGFSTSSNVKKRKPAKKGKLPKKKKLS